MDTIVQILIFQLNEQKYAIALSSVIRILRAAAVTTIPKVPLVIHGVIDLGGEMIPVVNLRRRMGYPECPIRLNDRFILAKTSSRTIILVVDTVLGMEDACESEFSSAESVINGMEIEGILKREDDVILIYDIDKFLPIEDEKILNEALLKVKND